MWTCWSACVGGSCLSYTITAEQLLECEGLVGSCGIRDRMVALWAPLPKAAHAVTLLSTLQVPAPGLCGVLAAFLDW